MSSWASSCNVFCNTWVIWILIKTLNFMQRNPQNIDIPKTNKTHVDLCPGVGHFIQEENTALGLDSKFAHRVQTWLPLHLLGHEALLVLSELPADSASLFGPQVQRLVLLPLKKKNKMEKWLEYINTLPPPRKKNTSKSLFHYVFDTLAFCTRFTQIQCCSRLREPFQSATNMSPYVM